MTTPHHTTPHKAKAVPDERAGGGIDEAPPPPHGTAIPVDDGPVPRVINPLMRVTPGSGLIRFKIGCRNYDLPEVLYVLAKTEEDARNFYLQRSGVAATIAKLKANGHKEPELAALVVTKLPD